MTVSRVSVTSTETETETETGQWQTICTVYSSPPGQGAISGCLYREFKIQLEISLISSCSPLYLARLITACSRNSAVQCGPDLYTTRQQKLLSTLLKFWTKITLKTQNRILTLTRTQNIKTNIKWSHIIIRIIYKGLSLGGVKLVLSLNIHYGSEE